MRTGVVQEEREQAAARGIRRTLSPSIVLLFAALLLVLPSCASLLGDSDTEERAESHMRLADSLEQASAIREAAFEYGLVVQHYPRTDVYPEAVRKAALLGLRSANTEGSDSVARSMILLYVEEGFGTQSERESMEALVVAMGRTDSLRRETRKREQAVDSLAVELRRQSSSNSGQSQRVVELEQQLRQVTEELRKLKQVDLDISRNRRQKSKG